MNKYTRLAMTVVALALSFVSMPRPGWAQHAGHGGGMSAPTTTAPAVPQYRTRTMKGNVIEFGNESVVVEGTYEGKVQRLTMMVDGRTKKKGAVGVGSFVKATFHEITPGVFHAAEIKPEKAKGR